MANIRLGSVVDEKVQKNMLRNMLDEKKTAGKRAV